MCFERFISHPCISASFVPVAGSADAFTLFLLGGAMPVETFKVMTRAQFMRMVKEHLNIEGAEAQELWKKAEKVVTDRGEVLAKIPDSGETRTVTIMSEELLD